MLPLLSVAILAGAFAQRITGMGFALVVSPFLVVLLGPFDGVLVVNACAVLSSLIILPRVWRDVEWGRLVRLAVPAVVGTATGAWVAAHVPGPAMQIGIGALVVIALTSTLFAMRTAEPVTGAAPAIAAGLASGFMNATAGVGGPAVSVYAVASRWPQLGFAATLQPYFIIVSGSSLIAKFAATGWALPELDPVAWPFILVAMLIGIGIGELLQRRISPRIARISVIAIAYLGGIAALVDGLLAVLS
ncbi:sulfite exporter TauE/SafE family protein [Agromyces archimandritae]|uniref:Probable membrane transporter protein n=1 Tax=Agromyces archimandritae TaxID=2781962 RepID=A0A975IPQ8_9MICO|nr:sulfite exporter TauE/SafE family protein [Agromyces archimandritae]QTX05855.1 sulfite exporter TauE/SafE family protein [Agromyces archimandritae]